MLLSRKVRLYSMPALNVAALQTILRREGYANPYETLKALTRHGDKVTPEAFRNFIGTLTVSAAVKEELLRVSPFTFIGVVPKE